MNTMQTGKPIKKTSWLRGPFLLASIPLILFVLCLIALGVREKIAADRVQAAVARIHDAGHPVDDASMNRWFIEHSSREGTKDWNEILRLAEAGPASFGNVERIPYVGGAAVPGDAAPVDEWPEEAEVAEYLRWMRPVIEQIHEATEYPTPVWQPIEFQGFLTLLEELQGSREIIRLLQLEAEHAIHHRDAERALRALDSMQGAAAAFDWPFSMVCDLVQIALRRVHQSRIRRSLATDIWDENQLRHLTDQLGPPREISERWQNVIAGERAMMMTSIAEQHLWDASDSPALVRQWLFALPSVQERLLQTYRRIEAVGAGGLEELAQRAEDLDQAWSTEAGKSRSLVLFPAQVHREFLPAVTSFATAIEREETSRRFALTALAVKRFQLQEGRWPENLTQLERVGLDASDWQTVSGGRFGYEVANKKVYLWSYEPQEETRVSSTRPVIDAEEGGTGRVVTIR